MELMDFDVRQMYKFPKVFLENSFFLNKKWLTQYKEN